ncbi:MAG: hypothetical protein K2G70_04290 [Turicibacter sp.]|nr:hypothetical protein [Turicibacter sp.]
MAEIKNLHQANKEKKDEFYVLLSIDIFDLLLNDSNNNKNMSRDNIFLQRIGGIACYV